MNITLNGVELNVKDQGTGQPTIVFLHYWGGSSRTWDAVTAALPAHYRVIAPDLRGWGDSSAPQKAYALDDFSKDIEALVRALNLKNYILVGHSMGGKIAQLFASRRPAGLAGLVLVAPSPPIPLVLPAQVRTAMQNAYNSAETVAMAIDQMLAGKPLSPVMRQQVIEDSLRGAPEAVAAWPNSTSYEDITKEVSAINVPTLVVAGEIDRIDSVNILQAEVLPRIAGSTLQILPATGHLSPLESPVELAAMIADFAEHVQTATAS